MTKKDAHNIKTGVESYVLYTINAGFYDFLGVFTSIESAIIFLKDFLKNNFQWDDEEENAYKQASIGIEEFKTHGKEQTLQDFSIFELDDFELRVFHSLPID